MPLLLDSSCAGSPDVTSGHFEPHKALSGFAGDNEKKSSRALKQPRSIFVPGASEIGSHFACSEASNRQHRADGSSFSRCFK